MKLAKVLVPRPSTLVCAGIRVHECRERSDRPLLPVLQLLQTLPGMPVQIQLPLKLPIGLLLLLGGGKRSGLPCYRLAAAVVVRSQRFELLLLALRFTTRHQALFSRPAKLPAAIESSDGAENATLPFVGLAPGSEEFTERLASRIASTQGLHFQR